MYRKLYHPTLGKANLYQSGFAMRLHGETATDTPWLGARPRLIPSCVSRGGSCSTSAPALSTVPGRPGGHRFHRGALLYLARHGGHRRSRDDRLHAPLKICLYNGVTGLPDGSPIAAADYVLDDPASVAAIEGGKYRRSPTSTSQATIGIGQRIELEWVLSQDPSVTTGQTRSCLVRKQDGTALDTSTAATWSFTSQQVRGY